MASRLGSLLLRKFSSAASGAEQHAGGGSKTWKYVAAFLAIPGVAVCWVNAYYLSDHMETMEERPPFVKYEFLRMRTHTFPWGDGNHTLFHNKHLNAMPEGYEGGEHEEE